MSTSTRSQALDQATEDAIAWLVLLRSGEATAADRSAFDGWLQHATRHQNAWQRLTGPVDGAFAAARSLSQRSSSQTNEANHLLSHALSNAMAESATHAVCRRRMLRGALALSGVTVGSALVAQRFTPLQDSFADFRTGTGERGRFTLPDGSSLLLNARSAVDVAFNSGQRTVLLRSGEVIADICAETSVPFVLQCRDGLVRTAAPDATSSTRILLRKDPDRSLAVTLSGRVEAVANTGARSSQWLLQGQSVWLSASGITPAEGAASTAMAWQQGLVTVNDQPLGDVIAALRPYRRGLLRISPEAAKLRVYGSYPLDDTDRALASISETLPVAVHVHSAGWLVRIELA